MAQSKPLPKACPILATADHNTHLIQLVSLVSGNDLAKAHGYDGVTAQCRAWWRSMGIRPLPGRKNVYDPVQVRHCLNQQQGLIPKEDERDAAPTSHVEQRKARKRAQ